MDRRFKIAAKITGGILATAAVAGAYAFCCTVGSGDWPLVV